MTSIFTIIILAILILFFIKLKYGLFLYILLTFLVPSLDICSIGGIKWITFNAALLLALTIYTQKNNLRISYYPLKPFIYLYLYYLLVIPLQFSTPYDYQLSTWVGQFFRYFILPISILTICKSNSKNILSFFNSAIYISIIIACVYGIILTQLDGINPYIILMFQEDAAKLTEYAMPTAGRIWGRIFSVFPHPMTFGVFLISSFFLCLSNLNYHKNKIFSLILLVLISVNAIMCGVRSVIVAIFIGLTTFIFLNKKMKYLQYIVIFLCFAFLIITTNEELTNYVISPFVSADESTVKGSSLELRIEQLIGCFAEISSNFLWGKGYDWTTFYNISHGDHPIILAFESLIFLIICNWGIIGCVVWCYFFKTIYKQNRKMNIIGLDKYHILNTYTFTYLSYTCITGDYAYTLYWIFFYVIIYLNLQINISNHNGN